MLFIIIAKFYSALRFSLNTYKAISRKRNIKHPYQSDFNALMCAVIFNNNFLNNFFGYCVLYKNTQYQI